MTPEQAIRFIRSRGVVLESAKGLEPSLAERIAGGPVRGSWWSHPQGHHIHELTQTVRGSRVVLVCGLAKGRVTYIHRRLWPCFVRLYARFPSGALDQIREVHLASGRHEREDIPFPAWVSEEIDALSRALSEADAAREIQPWVDRYGIA